jgi:predicted oxidoreductase
MEMEQVQLAKGLSFSRIALGMMRLTGWKWNARERLEFLEFCLDLGITVFDHADIYGDYTCERLFGEALALKPDLRERMVLVSKCGIKLVSSKRPDHRLKHYDTSCKHIIASTEQSLRNLGTDRLDVLLIHRPDPFMNPEEVAEAFDRLHRDGKVRWFGVSNFTATQLDMLASYVRVPLVTNQIEVSVWNLEHFANGTIDKCMELRIRPMAWSPLAGGRIFSSSDEKAVRLRAALENVAEETGAGSIDQVMLAWLFAHPAKMIPVLGTGKRDRIRAAVEALKLRLDRQHWFEIWRSACGHDVP